MRVFLFSLACTIAAAQSPESGQIVRHGEESTLIVDHPRPLDAAAITLAEQFHILVNVEDPQYLYKDDIRDVTAEVSRVPNAPKRIIAPKGARLEVRFRARPDGSPQDAAQLLQDLIANANARLPFTYRLDNDGGVLSIVPSTTRDQDGRGIQAISLLDRTVEIPAGTRTLVEHAKLITAALEQHTGGHVSCCQGAIAGLPWGLTKANFAATREPARQALNRMFRIEPGAGRSHWLMRCDPGLAWCFINLQTPPNL
jgi:hypothetical protein